MLVNTDQSVKAAGGYLIQLLPGADDALIDRLEQGIQAAGAVTGMLDSGLTAAQMLHKVLGEIEIEVLASEPVEYRCYCSRERVRGALVTLGEQDLTAAIAKGETLSVDCQFCDKVYQFTPEDLREILAKMKQ